MTEDWGLTMAEARQKLAPYPADARVKSCSIKLQFGWFSGSLKRAIENFCTERKLVGKLQDYRLLDYGEYHKLVISGTTVGVARELQDFIERLA